MFFAKLKDAWIDFLWWVERSDTTIYRLWGFFLVMLVASFIALVAR